MMCIFIYKSAKFLPNERIDEFWLILMDSTSGMLANITLWREIVV